MSVYQYALVIPLVLAIHFLATPAMAQETQPKQESTENAAVELQEMAELEKETLLAIYKSSASKNQLIKDHSYALLAQQKNLHQYLSAKQISELISTSLGGQSVDSQHGFALLDHSKISDQQQQDLLINAIASDDSSVVKKVFSRLTESSKTLLPRLIKLIEDDPAKLHINELRLIEHWGPKATTALPALIKNYDVLRKIALEKGIERVKMRVPNRRNGKQAPLPSKEKLLAESEKRLRFDYLPIVYAISEMGPAAKPALKIALAATQEKNRTEYNMAGVLCVERILGNSSAQRVSRERNRQVAALLGGRGRAMGGGTIRGVISGGGTIGGLMSGPIGSGRAQRSVRRVIEDVQKHTINENRDLDRSKVEEEVDLIFQNYDLYDRGQLSFEEIRKIPTPILISRADKDSDNKVSRGELLTYLSEKYNRERIESLRRSRSRSSRSR